MTTTLYERLGAAKGITKLVDDIVDHHMNNPVINARYLPLKDNPERFAMIRQHTINFLCRSRRTPEV